MEVKLKNRAEIQSLNKDELLKHAIDCLSEYDNSNIDAKAIMENALAALVVFSGESLPEELKYCNSIKSNFSERLRKML